jgi:hypothetical protein
MVVDEEWEKKVWEEAWDPRDEREEVGHLWLQSSPRGENRRKGAGRRPSWRREGRCGGEYKSDKGVARSRFLNEGVEKVGGVAGQSKIVFHIGLEWCMREILKPVADMAVEISTAGGIARGWEVWEGEQQEEEKPYKPVVAKKGKKA